jgi:hypothetical protein
VLPALAGLSGTSYLNSGKFSAGFHTASLISAGLCVAAGALAFLTIRNPRRAAPEAAAAARAEERPVLSCGLDGPPRRVAQRVTRS